MEIERWSSKELIAQLRELYQLLFVSDKSTVADLTMYYALRAELTRRGFRTSWLTRFSEVSV